MLIGKLFQEYFLSPSSLITRVTCMYLGGGISVIGCAKPTLYQLFLHKT